MIARPLRKVRSVNCTNATYNTIVDTLVEPKGDSGTATGSAVIEIGLAGNAKVPTFMDIWPYGNGNDNDTMNFRVIGWQRLLDPSLNAAGYAAQWCPSEIGEFVGTLSLDTGVAGGAVVAAERYCDVITVTAEETFTAATTRQGTVAVISPANDIRGHLRIDLEGVEKVEILFAYGGIGTPTMNALYRLYDRYGE